MSEQRPKSSSHPRLLTGTIALLLAVACVEIGLQAESAAGERGHFWHELEADSDALLPAGYQPPASLAALVEVLEPAVINVYTTQSVQPTRGRSERGRQLFEKFFGVPQGRMKRHALGSGVIISDDGYALTNHHVVAHASRIRVRLADGRELEAEVKGSDPKTDVALLQLEADGDLPYAHLGQSDPLQVGDHVIAIGNPFGLGHTVTSGIISGKSRVIGQGPYDDFLQTDASINMGNSGGPLFDARGRVVGLNTAIVAQGTGVGFAVPVDLVKELLPQLHAKGEVVRGWLGVGIQELDAELAEKFEVQQDAGVLVSQVFTDSPAERAGLRAGDVIVAVDGERMDDPRQLTRSIATIPPGTETRLTLLRDGERERVAVTLGTRAQGEARALGAPAVEVPTRNRLGLKLVPLTPERADRLGVDEDLRGLLVRAVDPEGPAARQLRPGDIILEVDRQRVRALGDLSQALDDVKDGDEVLLRIQRGPNQIYVVIGTGG